MSRARECHFCGKIPKGPATYREVNGEEVRVHKDCYIEYSQIAEDKYNNYTDGLNWREECIDYLSKIFNDDVDDFAIARLDGLRVSKFIPAYEYRYRYLDEEGYSYKKIKGLLEYCWENEDIQLDFETFELRANVIFKRVVTLLQDEEADRDYYKHKDKMKRDWTNKRNDEKGASGGYDLNELFVD